MELTNDKSNTYYLESAPIHKAIRYLSIPMMIGMSIGTIYTVVNAYFVGMLHNPIMLSSLTLGLPIFIILMAIGNMFGVGAGTFITRLIAIKEFNKAKKIASYALFSSFICGIILAIIAYFVLNPLMLLLGASGETFNLTKNYALALFVIGFTIILNFTLEQIVRSEGASKESMYGMGVSALINLIFDPILILYFNFNIVGAALAMGIANLASAIYYIYYLNYKSENLRGFIGNFKISLKDQFEIYKIGISELLQMSFMIVITLLLNHFSMSYGADVTAGFGIALRISQVPEFLSMGIFLGIMPLIAYNFSSKNFKRLYLAINNAFKYIFIISIIFVVLTFIFKLQIIKLFTNNINVEYLWSEILIAMLISALFNGLTGLFMCIFQSTGKGLPTAILGISQGILYIPIIILLNYTLGLKGIIWAGTITEFITFVIGFILYIPFNKEIKSNIKRE